METYLMVLSLKHWIYKILFYVLTVNNKLHILGIQI